MGLTYGRLLFFFSSRRRHTRYIGDWSSDVCSSDLEGGLVGVLTATSPPRLAHPGGGPELAGTNPLAIAIPSTDGKPIVADVSMGAVTYGDVIAGDATADRSEERRVGKEGRTRWLSE